MDRGDRVGDKYIGPHAQKHGKEQKEKEKECFFFFGPASVRKAFLQMA